MSPLASVHTLQGARLAGMASTVTDGCRVLEYAWQRDDGSAVVAVVHHGRTAAVAGCRLFRNPYANLRMAARLARQSFRAERRRLFREEARRSREIDRGTNALAGLLARQRLDMLLSLTSCTPDVVAELSQLQAQVSSSHPFA